MDRDNARASSQQQRSGSSQSQTPQTPPTESGRKARVVLISKMFASFPGQIGDRDAAMSAYLDEVSDIPLPWLRAGLARFKDEPDRTFLPSIAEVRTAVARAVQRVWRESRGVEQHSTSPEARLDIGGCLRIARKYPRGSDELLEDGPPLVATGGMRCKIESGERHGPADLDEGLGDVVMTGLQTGEDFQVMAREIWAEGREVPSRAHADKAHSMQGCCLALALARHRCRVRPILSTIFNLGDWHRYNRAMERHVEEGGDGAWWEDVKTSWKVVAQRCIAGQGPARGRRNR